MKEQLDWTKAIQLTKYTNLEKNVLSYLKICSENEQVVNLHCYIDEKIVKNSKKLIKKYSKAFNKRNYDKLFDACAEGNQGILQLLAPIMPNPNAPDKDGKTPIHWAAIKGHTEIVRILAVQQTILMPQMKSKKLQFIGQPLKDIQKLSESWPL